MTCCLLMGLGWNCLLVTRNKLQKPRAATSQKPSQLSPTFTNLHSDTLHILDGDLLSRIRRLQHAVHVLRHENPVPSAEQRTRSKNKSDKITEGTTTWQESACVFLHVGKAPVAQGLAWRMCLQQGICWKILFLSLFFRKPRGEVIGHTHMRTSSRARERNLHGT